MIQFKTQKIVLFLILAVCAYKEIQARDFSELVIRGELARIRGEYSTANENFKTALKLAENSADKSKQAQIFIHLGHLSYIQAQYLDAIKNFRKAEKLANEVKDTREEARAWAFLGQLYWRVGKVADGEKFLTDALRVFEKSNDEINIALVLRFLGRLEDGKAVAPRNFYAQNEGGIFPKSLLALKYYERSLAISRRIGDEEGELTTLKEIGLTFQGQYTLPNFLERGMSYFEPLRVRLKNSDYRRLYAVVLNNMATNAERRKASEEAHEYADEAISIFREIGDLQELREMLDTKSRIYLQQSQDFDRAEPFIEESIKISRKLYNQPIGDALDRQRYFESLIHGYRQKVRLAEYRRRPDEMLEAQEEMRSWVLLELMRRQKTYERKNLSADEKLEEKAFTDELAKLNRQIVRIRQTNQRKTAQIKTLDENLQNTRLLYEEWQAEIAAKYQKSDTTNEIKTLSFEQMCETLPDEKTAVLKTENSKYSPIQFFILTKAAIDIDGRDNLNRFSVVKRNLPNGQTCSVITFHSEYRGTKEDDIKNSDFHQRIKEFQQQISENSPAFKKNSRYLYDVLLADALSMVKNVEHIIFATSGNVSNIPFQALMNKQNRYLIENYSISYAPSITTLAEMQANYGKLAAHVYEGDFLAFGNPKLSNETIARFRTRYRDGKLETLPEAETEVRAIGKFYSKNKIVTGKNATENFWQTESSKYRILHLATHGLSDAEKPLYSHVLLSSDFDDDGLIEGREIAEMNLNAEMVVLSACETARGREIDGEGMVGLAWSFAAAGTPTIIASNWKIDSAATADFMIDFYKFLNLNKQTTKSAAIQKAMLAKLKNAKTSHPFYWAGFSIYGNQ